MIPNIPLLMSPLRPAPNQDTKFTKLLKEQSDFVDRETLSLQFMMAYNRDVRNLEVFIAPDILKDLNYDTDSESLWEFCSDLSDAVAFGVLRGKRVRKKTYLGLKSNGIFTGLCFMEDTKVAAFSVLDITDWVKTIDFRSI